MSFCGIDFGTSNSALSAETSGEINLLPVEEANDSLPSAVFYPAAAPPVFGRMAQNLFFEGEEGRFMRSLKRILGTPLMEQGTIINGKRKRFESIIADFLRQMKTTAEAASGQSFDSVVMGRPVHFIDHDPEGDRRAEQELCGIAKSVGFKNIEFQFEPIAAAFAHERRLTEEKLALVADIGGGTSDFTVIRLSPDNIGKAGRSGDILANSGLRTGGNDFDKALSLACFMPSFGYQTAFGEKGFTLPLSPFHDLSEWSKVNVIYTPRFKKDLHDMHAESHEPQKLQRLVTAADKELGHRILAEVEHSKIRLTSADSHRASLGYIEKDFWLAITRADFNQSIEKDVRRIAATIDDCLQLASLKAQEIDMLILTGGPTETPSLKTALRRQFPNALLSEENKLSSVAIGLGLDAAQRFRHTSLLKNKQSCQNQK